MRRADLGPDPPLAEFDGGARFGIRLRVGFPIVRLSVYRLGMRLGPSPGWPQALFPVWEARFDDLLRVRVRHALVWRGVKVVTKDHRSVVFWPHQRLVELETLLHDLGLEWLDEGGYVEPVRFDPPGSSYG